MAQESVVLEDAVVSSNGTEHSANDDELEGFEFIQYARHFANHPDATAFLSKLFASRSHGWKRRAHMVLALDRAYKSYKDYTDRVLQVATPDSLNYRGTRKLGPKDHLRKYLESLGEPELQALCEVHDVSYDAFMRTADRDGLLESIMDEMVRVASK